MQGLTVLFQPHSAASDGGVTPLFSSDPAGSGGSNPEHVTLKQVAPELQSAVSSNQVLLSRLGAAPSASSVCFLSLMTGLSVSSAFV